MVAANETIRGETAYSCMRNLSECVWMASLPVWVVVGVGWLLSGGTREGRAGGRCVVWVAGEIIGGGRAVSLGGAVRNMHGPRLEQRDTCERPSGFYSFWARHDPLEERDTCERLSGFYFVLGAT